MRILLFRFYKAWHNFFNSGWALWKSQSGNTNTRPRNTRYSQATRIHVRGTQDTVRHHEYLRSAQCRPQSGSMNISTRHAEINQLAWMLVYFMQEAIRQHEYIIVRSRVLQVRSRLISVTRSYHAQAVIYHAQAEIPYTGWDTTHRLWYTTHRLRYHAQAEIPRRSTSMSNLSIWHWQQRFTRNNS